MTDPLPDECCAKCRFFLGLTQACGYCRRHPRIVVVISDYLNYAYPGTDVDDWCGEYQPRTKETPTT